MLIFPYLYNLITVAEERRLGSVFVAIPRLSLTILNPKRLLQFPPCEHNLLRGFASPLGASDGVKSRAISTA